MTDDEIKGLFYSYGQYVSGKDYALIRAIEKVIAPQRTDQEPVIDKSAAIRIATALGWEPKREWVGLDHHDKKKFSSWLGHKSDDEVFTAIEALLKEMNT